MRIVIRLVLVVVSLVLLVDGDNVRTSAEVQRDAITNSPTTNDRRIEKGKFQPTKN